jgi:nucleoid-associated protein YgaU
LLIGGFEGYLPYRVQPGDTLSSITAAEYGDASRWSTINPANQRILPNPDLIFTG